MPILIPKLPIELIKDITSYADTETRTNTNRVLDPSDRVVKKIDSQKLVEHEGKIITNELFAILKRNDELGNNARDTSEGLKLLIRMYKLISSETGLKLLGKQPRFRQAFLGKATQIAALPAEWFNDPDRLILKALVDKTILEINRMQ